MPELPEVETVVRAIRPAVVGHTITNVWLDWVNSLQTPDETTFRARLPGQKILGVERRAKYIVLQLEADWLLIHLKMTGRLYVVPDAAQQEADRWVHFCFQLENEHQLRFSDARKFGRVALTANREALLGKLGPEPLAETFTVATLQERLAQRRGRLKPLLLDQTFIAGVGNIYADEALHYAHLAPLRHSDTLSEAEIQQLYDGIRYVLNKGIERQGASINWYRQPDGSTGSMQDEFFAYDRTGQVCRTCGVGIIQKITVGQRGTHYCPNCQK